MSLAAILNNKHSVMPMRVGVIRETRVHLRLPVSFFMVRQVVAQGQCIRENSSMDTAVVQLQPFCSSSALSSDRLE